MRNLVVLILIAVVVFSSCKKEGICYWEQTTYNTNGEATDTTVFGSRYTGLKHKVELQTPIEPKYHPNGELYIVYKFQYCD